VPRAPDALALLDAFEPEPGEDAARSVRCVRALLSKSAQPFSRYQFDPGHVTASGLVLSPDARALLLVFHRRLGRWLQPGGHVEPQDPELEAAARREVMEETGVKLRPNGAAPLVGVDVHAIPARADEPAHWHHDLAFGFIAEDEHLEPSAGHQARWVEIERLGELHPDQALRRSLVRALQAWSLKPAR
jgi:8-oxo-dGTP pyrophosphatase MutT (NUDIX family)